MITLLQQPSQHRRLRIWLLLGALAGTPALFADPFGTGPDVTIIAGENEVIYEFRQNGTLRMIRVVPNWGRPYYLVPQDPTRGNGDLDQAGALVPSWTLKEFDSTKR
ncbi:MAG TPA: DUF2782 domain-containing protein [Gammaproteobacteria bacterium]|nr:DUF2782 domain-containing protein [Gammaproteobacteria bacterium]